MSVTSVLPNHTVVSIPVCTKTRLPLFWDSFKDCSFLGGTFLVIKVFLCLFLMHQYPQERAREQCEYVLAQHIEMFCNLPYERPRAQEQMGQGQENQGYHPREQVQEQPESKMSTRDGCTASLYLFTIPLLVLCRW